MIRNLYIFSEYGDDNINIETNLIKYSYIKVVPKKGCFYTLFIYFSIVDQSEKVIMEIEFMDIDERLNNRKLYIRFKSLISRLINMTLYSQLTSDINLDMILNNLEGSVNE